MLAQPTVSSFIAGTNVAKVLPTGLLPLNNNPSILDSCPSLHTTLVVDRDGNTPVAFGIMNKYSTKQAYCMVGKVADRYARCRVEMQRCPEEETEQRHTVYKVLSSLAGRQDKSQMRPYDAVFGDENAKFLQVQIADALFDQTIGEYNMDMEKNVTIDIIGEESSNLDIWRDHSGFVVADGCRFTELTCDSATLLSTLSSFCESTPDSITAIAKDSISDVLEFDSAVTLYHREAFVDYLARHEQVRGYVAQSADKVVTGYALASGDRILQCYSENADVAAKLVSTAVSYCTEKTVSLFAQLGVSRVMDAVANKAITRTPVTRLHTRTRTTQVKWPMVHVANVGLSLF